MDLDKLYLSKSQIVEVIDAIIFYWQAQPGRNWTYTNSLRGIKMAVLIMDENILRAIWSQVIRAFMELYSLSEMKRLAGETPDAQFFYETLLRKIQSGELFGRA